MDGAEYKVVAAPRRGVKKGARTPEDRYALAVQGEIQRLAAEGWDYLRSDTFPCEERQGWFGKAATVYRTVMVFRRDPAPVAVAPAPAAPAVEEPPRWTPPPRAARPAAPAPAAVPAAPLPLPAAAVAPVPAAPVPPRAVPQADWPLADPRLRAREAPPPPRRAPPAPAPAQPLWEEDVAAADPRPEPPTR